MAGHSSWDTVQPGQPILHSLPLAGRDGRATAPRVRSAGRARWSLVLDDVTEPALGPEQLAAGLVVGDPVTKVFGQLRGLHLQGEMGRFPLAPLPMRTRGVQGGAPSQGAAFAPLGLCSQFPPPLPPGAPPGGPQ